MAPQQKGVAAGTEFSIGDEVEVSFERDDSYDIWFPATVVKYLSENKYLVKYWFRKESGEALLQNSTVSLQRIRPAPPPNKTKRGFVLFDKVDAFYDFAWTSVLIVKELGDKKFMVSCKRTNNIMVFSENKLRPHVEWVDGRWIYEFNVLPKEAVNDALQSKPSNKSEIENATEIANSTSCKADATETKTPSKQNSFLETKTPTSTICETHAAVSKRRRNVSALKTLSRSLDDKVPKVAKNDASPSSPSKKSKTKTAAVIIASTLCETDARKRKLSSSHNSSEEPKTPTSTVCQTDAEPKGPINISSLKMKTCSLDDKVNEGKEVSGLDNSTILSLKRRERPPKTPHSSTKGNESNAGARTAEETNAEECETELVLPLARNRTESPKDDIRRQSHIKGSQTSISDHKGEGRYPAALVIEPEVYDNGASHSRPSKKTKMENAVAIIPSTGCKTDATKAKSPMEQDSSQEPKTPTSTVCQTGAATLKTPSNVSSLKTDRCSLEDKVTKGKKVRFLNNCTTESLRRSGRPPRTPRSATRGNKSNGGTRTVEETDEKVCRTEHVLVLAQNETRSPQGNSPCHPHMEGYQTSISDQKGQGHNPAGLVIEESPKNSQRKQMNTSSDLSGPRSKKELPTKSSEMAKRTVSSYQAEKSPSKKRGKTSMDPSTKSNDSDINGKETLSSTKVGKTSVDPSAKSHNSAIGGVPQEHTEVHAVAISKSPCIGTDVNQILPFGKTVPLWNFFESLEIFQSLPQNPHFRPLESSDEDCREGLAIGHMVTFLKIIKKIPELRLDMPRSSMKMSLENLVVLEDNGFDVKSVRDRLNDLLVKKDKHDLLQNDLKENESQIMECKKKKAEIDETLDEIDKKLNELRAKREAVVSKKELKDAAIAVSQSSMDHITNHMKSVQSDFEDLAVACW